jgi:hypothetical protein
LNGLLFNKIDGTLIKYIMYMLQARRNDIIGGCRCGCS